MLPDTVRRLQYTNGEGGGSAVDSQVAGNQSERLLRTLLAYTRDVRQDLSPRLRIYRAWPMGPFRSLTIVKPEAWPEKKTR